MQVRLFSTDDVDMFLICVYGLQARGIQNPNAMVGMLVFMGGLCQFLAGIMEFVNKNPVCPTTLRSMSLIKADKL